MNRFATWAMCVALVAGCGAGDAPAKFANEANFTEPAPEGQVEGGPIAASSVQRRIIYNATVDLVVEDFSPVPDKVSALVKQVDGFVADSEVHGQIGDPRGGYWKIRVPVERFDEFLTAARILGEVRVESRNSEDVSEKFYDLQARLRNKKQEEQRLIELLDKHSGKLEEILAVEREISRVRGEVEQLEGKIRVISDLTNLATVTLKFEEIKNYVPPAAPTFGSQVARTWSGSLVRLTDFGKGLTITIIFVTPWLLVLGVPMLVILWFIKRKRRPRQTS